MDLAVDLQIANPSRYPINRERLFGVVEKTLNQRGVSGKIEVSLLVVGEKDMAGYNRRYHDADGPTDVLSFPYTDPQSQVSDEPFVIPADAGQILGDLIVCYPVAEAVAQKEGKSPQDLVDFYVEHGLMHLLGHHHA